MSHIVWEYLTTSAGELDDERLNVLGAEGWELVMLHDSRAIFKRAGYNLRERITIEQRERLEVSVKGPGDEA